jgi:thioredoxin reductase
MQDRVLSHENVEVHFNTAVRDAFGDGKGLKGLILYDTQTSKRLIQPRVFSRTAQTRGLSEEVD